MPSDLVLAASSRPAALATLTVENQTERALVIAFRPAVPPHNEVIVGRVSARGSSAMAPVPAAEPIILVARTEDNAEYELSARSFDLDETWRWVIPADARFVLRGSD